MRFAFSAPLAVIKETKGGRGKDGLEIGKEGKGGHRRTLRGREEWAGSASRAYSKHF